jgi:hypothetical protein
MHKKTGEMSPIKVNMKLKKQLIVYAYNVNDFPVSIKSIPNEK